jgi:hypothetical protein
VTLVKQARNVVLLCALVLGAALSVDAARAGDDAPDWIGCWVEADPDGQALLLEEERCGWRRAGKTDYYRLSVREGSIELESWGRVTTLALRVEGDRLHVVQEGEERVFERTDEVPANVALEPYPLPERAEVDPDTVAALQAEFAYLGEEDQRVRRAAENGQFTPEQLSEMHEVDERLTARLLTVIAEHGWIDATRFGSAASDVAFLIVQHSGDLRLMRAALPWIETDVEAGRLSGQNYALLFDRLQLNLGYRQRYGSQLCTLANGESALMPCEDMEHVDERRAKLGMPPLASYLAFWERDGSSVRTLEEALARPRQD